jgi:hypothetical protein
MIHDIRHFPEIIQYCFCEKSENFFKFVEFFKGSDSELFKLFGADEEETLRNIRRSEMPDQSKNYLYSFLKGIHLAQELKDFGCDGIQRKFLETPDWDKFLSLKSELLFAHAFAKLGFSISLISDSSQEWSTKSPDILLEKNGQKTFVEVARIGYDETVSEVLNKLNSCFQDIPNLYVWIEFSQEFSSPTIIGDDWKERDALVNKFVNDFKEILPLISKISLPETIEIQSCQVKFSSQPCFSYRRVDGIPSPIFIPQDKLNQKIKQVLESKAEKRKKWTDSQKTCPYLVALDIYHGCQFQFALINLLFGESRCYDVSLRPPEYCEPPLVSQAKLKGWCQLLESVGYKPQPQSRIISPGILLSDPCIFQNVTGIVVNIWDSLQFVPNPFAEEQINRPDFQEIITWPLLPKDDLIFT